MLLAQIRSFFNGHNVRGRQRRDKALERRKRKKNEKERKARRNCTLMQARSGYTFFLWRDIGSDYGGARGKHNFKTVYVTFFFLTPIRM